MNTRTDDTANGLEAAPSVRVRTHPGLCTASGECHRWAPDIYPLDADGRVALHVLEVDGALADAAWWGAAACPARAITVIGPPEEFWRERWRRLHEDAASRLTARTDEEDER